MTKSSIYNCLMNDKDADVNHDEMLGQLLPRKSDQ